MNEPILLRVKKVAFKRISQELFNQRRSFIYDETITALLLPRSFSSSILNCFRSSGEHRRFEKVHNCSRPSKIIVKQVERTSTQTDTVSLLSLSGKRDVERDTHAVFRLQTFRIVGFICEEARESQANWSRRISHVLSAKLNNSVYNDKNSNTRKIRFESEASKTDRLISVCNKDGCKWEGIEIRWLSRSLIYLQLIFYFRNNTVNLAVHVWLGVQIYRKSGADR